MKTSELTGDKLDYWVGIVNMPKDYIGTLETWGVSVKFAMKHGYSPTNNWQQCGELIEKHEVLLSYDVESFLWYAMVDRSVVNGATPQEAICRAVVASVYGEEVTND